MSQLTDLEVKQETQNVLENINEMTKKIKAEFKLINQLIDSNGQLGKLANEANQKLINQAQQLGKKVTLDAEDSDEVGGNHELRSSIDAVTQKLMGIMEDS
ncbi:hypothetical protein KQX54_007636 [Cotesia glomerata]|uniref:Uncharacterized protein n=1 Tax=Cotesia glomerata TaxID=32391 RepID=A0AAV7I268_COTGL|nr:hypothetical protein KQX54_007636 [Cotesia glomerata]